MNEPMFWRAKAACEFFGLSDSTLRRYRQRGLLVRGIHYVANGR